MSGVFKAVGKVFKKVVKVAKKIAIPALLVGAVVLTGGAALGMLPAVGSVLGGLGLSAGVTSVLTSAVTSAGWGALAGGVLGGKKGFITGGLLGAATGGLGGILAGPGGAAAKAAGSAAASGGGLAPGVSAGLMPGTGAAAGSAIATTGAAGAAGAAGGAAAAGAAGSGNFLTGLLSNPTIVGNAISGLGAGVSNKATVKASEKAKQAEIDRINGNYAIGGGLLAALGYSGTTGGGNAATGTADYDPMSGAGMWYYDARAGQLVRRQPAGAG
jgi:hypothetical protein